MVNLIDTHSHPYYDTDSALFVEEALKAGVTKIVTPNVDIDSIEPMKRLADAFPQNIFMAMGLHPTEVNDNAEEILERIMSELKHYPRYIAIGEIGIDLYWDKTFKDKQMQIFDRQLAEATKADLPVIIHCREALSETLEVLENHKNISAVFHSFGGNATDVERILAQNQRYMFGINGIVTFKNSSLRETIPVIPSENLLLETDSPYLAPVPFRGKTNRSAYLPYIARSVADAKKMSVDDIALLTTNNAKAFFRI